MSTNGIELTGPRAQYIALEQENARLREDKARLDKLEAYLADNTKNLGQPNPPHDLTWQFGYNGGMAYVIDGQGDTLREAIDSLP